MNTPGRPATRREFLELTALATAGVMVGGGLDSPAEATPPAGKLTRTPLAQGRLEEAITLSTSGPSDFHIHQVTVEPGGDSGWHTHPGTALDIVKSGTMTVHLAGEDCEPITLEAGQAFFVPAGIAHLATNGGSEPAEIYVTYLVAAGTAPRDDAEVPDNCGS